MQPQSVYAVTFLLPAGVSTGTGAGAGTSAGVGTEGSEGDGGGAEVETTAAEAIGKCVQAVFPEASEVQVAPAGRTFTVRYQIPGQAPCWVAPGQVGELPTSVGDVAAGGVAGSVAVGDWLLTRDRSTARRFVTYADAVRAARTLNSLAFASVEEGP